MILPTKSRQYRPTQHQWRMMEDYTELMLNHLIPYSRIELIDFKTSKVHLKGGKRVGFDCLSESQYVHVCNGGYYEEAPEIDGTKRID